MFLFFRVYFLFTSSNTNCLHTYLIQICYIEQSYRNMMLLHQEYRIFIDEHSESDKLLLAYLSLQKKNVWELGATIRLLIFQLGLHFLALAINTFSYIADTICWAAFHRGTCINMCLGIDVSKSKQILTRYRKVSGSPS